MTQDQCLNSANESDSHGPRKQGRRPTLELLPLQSAQRLLRRPQPSIGSFEKLLMRSWMQRSASGAPLSALIPKPCLRRKRLQGER